MRLARLAANVVIKYLDLQACRKYGGEIVADSVLEKIAHLDILTNNAGGLVGEVSGSSASRVSEEDLRATLDRTPWEPSFAVRRSARP